MKCSVFSFSIFLLISWVWMLTILNSLTQSLFYFPPLRSWHLGCSHTGIFNMLRSLWEEIEFALLTLPTLGFLQVIFQFEVDLGWGGSPGTQLRFGNCRQHNLPYLLLFSLLLPFIFLKFSLNLPSNFLTLSGIVITTFKFQRTSIG